MGRMKDGKGEHCPPGCVESELGKTFVLVAQPCLTLQPNGL